MSGKVRQIKKERSRERNISLQLLKNWGRQKGWFSLCFHSIDVTLGPVSLIVNERTFLIRRGKKSVNTWDDIETANHNVFDFAHRWWQLITCWIITQMWMFNKYFFFTFFKCLIDVTFFYLLILWIFIGIRKSNNSAEALFLSFTNQIRYFIISTQWYWRWRKHWERGKIF